MYTNIRTHDEAARTENITLEFRKNLVLRQIEEQTGKIHELTNKLSKLKADLPTAVNSTIKIDAFFLFLDRIITSKKLSLIAKHNRKLTDLYGGPICMKVEKQRFLNLSDVNISPELAAIFDLGMNCHLRQKYDTLVKKIQIEKLYKNIQAKSKDNTITISEDDQLKCELKRFGLRKPQDFSKNLLDKDQFQLVKDFTRNPDVITRKADKSNLFVIMNKQNYVEKIDHILSDQDKFVKSNKDPTPQLKKKLRDLIEIIHAKNGAVRFPMPVGHYEPGYIYGNAKIHKNQEDPPLRPIISQIGTPTYEIAKKLNNIIAPYMPARHMINSTDEFINIARGVEEKGYLASLDVESLFTNVPVKDTIDIIIENVYKNPNMSPPDIPEVTMRTLLEVCTTETPFRNFNGDIYLQKDGCSMGSPLGPLFANMYMCYIENNVIPSLKNPPIVYTRYVDDIFLLIKNINTLEEIKSKFEAISVLKFTYEIEYKKCISFLDVNVTRKNETLETSVHTKPTSSGECMNYFSIAPERYKQGVITTLLHRAYTVCSSWLLFHQEVLRIKQVLVNNNYPESIVDKQIALFLSKKYTLTEEKDANEEITFFYKGQMTSQYKQEESALHKIMSDHIQPTGNKKIKLHIYYNNKKVRNLFLKNNPHQRENGKESHVVYSYRCSKEECQPFTTYVGYTECTLTDRMRNHAQNGSIIKHSVEKHSTKLTTKEILDNTSVLHRFYTKDELVIAEALLIKEMNPPLNAQNEGETRVLLIF